MMKSSARPNARSSAMDSEVWRRILLSISIVLTGVFIGLATLRLPTAYVLALVLGIAFLCLSVRRMEVPFLLCVLLLMILFESDPLPGSLFGYLKDPNIPGIPSLLEMMLGVLILSLGVRLVFQRNQMVFSPLNVTLLAFLGLLMVSLLIGLQNSNNGVFLKEDLKRFLFPVLFFVCAINILNSERKIRFLMVFILAVAIPKAWLGSLDYLRGAGFPYGDTRVVFLEGADHLIFVTIMMVFISFFVSGRVNGGKLIITLLAVPPMIFPLVFSYRRTAWVGILLSLVILFLLVRGNRKLRMLAIGISAVLIVFLLTSFSNVMESLPSGEFLRDRFASIWDAEQSSNDAHFKEWEVTVEDTMKHPIFGLGLGAVHRPVPGYPKINTHTVHNAFLMLWMKMGIFPVFLFLWCLIRYLIFGFRTTRAKAEGSLKPVQIGLFSSFGFWIVSFSVGATWWSYRETCLMALVGAVLIAFSRTTALASNRETEMNRYDLG